MIFSCSDWKLSDHLGVKIPRIGLPPLGSVSPMNVEASGSRLDAEYVVIRNGDSPHIIETDARK